MDDRRVVSIAEAGSLGMTLEPLPGLGLRVRRVAEGGLASRCGLLAGQVLLELNGLSMAGWSLEEFRDAFLRSARPLQLTVGPDLEAAVSPVKLADLRAQVGAAAATASATVTARASALQASSEQEVLHFVADSRGAQAAASPAAAAATVSLAAARPAAAAHSPGLPLEATPPKASPQGGRSRPQSTVPLSPAAAAAVDRQLQQQQQMQQEQQQQQQQQQLQQQQEQQEQQEREREEERTEESEEEAAARLAVEAQSQAAGAAAAEAAAAAAASTAAQGELELALARAQQAEAALAAAADKAKAAAAAAAAATERSLSALASALHQCAQGALATPTALALAHNSLQLTAAACAVPEEVPRHLMAQLAGGVVEVIRAYVAWGSRAQQAAAAAAAYAPLIRAARKPADKALAAFEELETAGQVGGRQAPSRLAVEAARKEALWAVGELTRLEAEAGEAGEAAEGAARGAAAAGEVIKAALGVLGGAIMGAMSARAALKAERLPVLLQRVLAAGLGVSSLPKLPNGTPMLVACRDL
jgi:hypothetical protein